MNFSRSAFWLDQGVFGVLYEPEAVTDEAWLFVPSFGHEYTHSHRALRFLAAEMSSHGCQTLRIDYRGTGNSSGSLSAHSSVSEWQEDISAGVEFLRNRGARRVSLFGIGFGATMAATAHADVERLVLWAPELKGRKYVRRLTAVAKLAENTELVQGFTDIAGFRISDRFLKGIAELELQKCLKGSSAELVLLADDMHAAKLQNADAIVVPGLADVLCEPQKTKLPLDVCRLLTSQFAPDKKSLQSAQASTSNDDVTQLTDLPGNQGTESVQWVGENRLMVMISEPKNVVSSRPIIVMSNSGSVHTVGPNRLYKEISDTMTVEGFVVVRFDLRNLGESVEGHPDNENNPHPREAFEDIQTILENLEQRYASPSFLFLGLCSGAHAAFQSGQRFADQFDVKECILMNPLGFSWDESLPIDIPVASQTSKDAKYYRNQLLRARSWARLLQGKVDYRYIARFIGARTLQKVKSLGSSLLEGLGLLAPTALGEQLLNYRNHRIQLTLLYATNDPGMDILLHEGGKTAHDLLKKGTLRTIPIKGGDHTFSNPSIRTQVLSTLASHISRYSGEKE